MKKTLMAAIAATALLPMISCGNNHTNVPEKGDEIFTGVLPAADCEGIRYTLKLDYDDDHGNLDGDYDLLETYLVNDTTKKINHSDSVSYKTEGKFTVENGTGDKANVKYLKLVPDRNYTNGSTLYFIVDSDSQLTLTDAQLNTSNTPGLNYTLKLVK
ncbi:MAG: copper resistance protein NlpE N-terminal domain-containing protein [Candidatus Amulumruptor caecigallinarius]|nr:copper resistance protein NlpE N-terminal domain-containing protein [Candidatus Amulumruptor caecigallinarius]